MYLDPVRFEYSGDLVRARSYGHTARKLLFGLKRRIADSGIESARDRQVMTDGTVIEIVLAGMLAMAHIHSPTGARVIEGNTMAYVASNATSPPRITFVDVEREKELFFITGLGSLNGMAIHPNGRYIFALSNAGQLIKLDVEELTASAVTIGQPAIDVFLSPDGARVHVRKGASGGLGSPTTFGMIRTFSSEDMAHLGDHPVTLQSAFMYRGTARRDDGRLYLPTFGNGDGDPNTADTSGHSDGYQDAIEVYDWAGGALVAGAPLNIRHLASSTRWGVAVVNEQGDRLFVASNRPISNGVAQPTVKVFDVGGNALGLLAELAVGYTLTSDIAVSRSGAFAFVKDADGNGYAIRQSGEARDQYAVSDPFPTRPVGAATFEMYHARRTIQIGPERAPLPDNRVFFLSGVAKTLWAFKVNSVVPDKKIALSETPEFFVLGRAPAKVKLQ